MSRVLLTNARVVLRDEVAEGAAVLIEDGRIAGLDPANSGGADVIDLAGKLLMPGLIDLHADALEGEIEPRPNVTFPVDFAFAQSDKRNAMVGITTVYHAISFAHEQLGLRNNNLAAQIIRGIHSERRHALVDNRVHARYEVTDVAALPLITGLLDEGLVHMLSFMDHSPGQGQFRDVASFRDYLRKAYRKSDAELDTIIAQKGAAAETMLDRMQQLAEASRAHGIALASHDDDCIECVETAVALGATISEFPLNLETAKAAKQQGLATLVGAPNLLRQQSSSGGLRAIDAIVAGVADCLCSDYSPAAMLTSVMRLPECADLSLPEAIAFVTANPARIAGLQDRGAIDEGRRADLIAVRTDKSLPRVERVWVGGRQVLMAYGDGV